jgi:formylglycine-generating enzyme required for sulfatase activity
MPHSQLIRRTATFALVAIFAVVAPLHTLIPSVEAASPSASARVIQKLKKQIATLKKQLAAATTPPAPFIELVKVGNVGNAPDQNFGQGALGRVNYEFQIGKTEVTLAQYTAFLNAVAATDTHALYSSALATNENIAGIAQNGTSGNFTYSVIGTGTRPVTFVSWFDAARFCNWLHNGRPTGAQNAGTTEQGAYTLDGTISGGLDIVRNPGARFWIPSENEWYKAAYHQPAAQGGDADDYWLYPTRSNTPPGNQIGPLPLANHANLRFGSIFSVTQAAGLSPTQNYLTEPGSYPASASFYGTTDQGGNVGEWTEGVVITFSERAVRGGDWNSDEARVRSSVDRNSDSRIPSTKRSPTGFRVAAP